MTKSVPHSYIDLEIRFDRQAYDDLVSDMVTFYLSEIGFEAFQEDEEGSGMHAYIVEECYSEGKTLDALLKAGIKDPRLRKSIIEERNWNEVWEQNYHNPVEVVPGRVVIRASFHPERVDLPFDIVIDPKMAFGTGGHATTSGMIRLIDSMELPSRTVLDMGCGSGVLGIFALKKGAAHCTAIDIDIHSVENARENALANGVELDIRHGDASLLQSGEIEPVDLFLANITRNIILSDLESYLHLLKEQGTLLLSGFLTQDLPLIRSALEERGMRITETLNPEGEWVAISAEREREASDKCG